MADLKQLARRIFQETLTSIDIPATMQRKLRCVDSRLYCGNLTVDVDAYEKIRVVAVGKAAHAMLGGLRALLPSGTSVEGVLSAPTRPAKPARGISYFSGGHPIPNEESWKAAEAVLALLKECDERTAVFFLLSGGGSALMELPLDPGSALEDMQRLYEALVTCGAPIADLGIVRRHVSAVKGGRLAAAAGRAAKITLAVSDVPVGQEAALASGPTLPDATTIVDVERVLRKYGLRDKLPVALRQWMDEARMPESPKENHPAFANAYFSLLLGMDDLFHPAHHAAEGKGCVTCCDNTTDDWPVEKAADFLLTQLEALRVANPGQLVALIADGELSSPVTGNGIGGRNAAFVLACVEKIAGRQVVVLSAGTDGMDGNSPAAGAVADGESSTRARGLGMEPRDFFQRSDAYTFFERLQDAIVTGPTGNNLRDLRILIADPVEKEH